MTTIEYFDDLLEMLLNSNKKSFSIENLYSVMYKHETIKFTNILHFVNYLNETTISEMNVENIEKYINTSKLDITLLDNNIVNIKLFEILDTLNNRAETRFDKLYKFCQNHKYGQIIYTNTRLFISNYPIIHRNIFKNIKDGIELKLLSKLPTISKKDRDFIFDYVKSNYKTINVTKDKIGICERCGYLIGNDSNSFKYHKQCQGYKTLYIEASNNLLVAEASAYKDIVLPTRLEIEIKDALDKHGYKYELFPSLELEGDIKVYINDTELFLDAKAYEIPAYLKEELDKKPHYKNRLIIVPSRVYNSMSDLKAFGYKIYSIDTLLQYLKGVI
ncbi:hypothetical protein SAMN02745163_02515 [Clostridium cavendishii DSM 21758]|uniref:REase associating with pPIWI RE domain-containing protein n=1 Tax=Clostridium cavendishii DSM 21758 TaxID=1121302 RepID=A0A1M6LW28_9CLOT|nr:hypothetical protein [Clostridium cavendishii]SHJ75398.1 hypothetical protein SAMN02745163_02515 [Clostridium cavendishii DSM 21758]